jgi:hypothetical protein
MITNRSNQSLEPTASRCFDLFFIMSFLCFAATAFPLAAAQLRLVRSMIAWLAIAVVMLVFLVVGVAATFYTERLRTHWICKSEQRPNEIYWRIVGRRVRSERYSRELRLIGIMCFGTVALMMWGFLPSWWGFIRSWL